MRYGTNPHQKARLISGGPRVITGEPSMINYLDAVSASALARELDNATGLPSATSFKHVSPAGAAVAGIVDDTAAETWRLSGTSPESQVSAYARARDADPKSSFGDVVALSRPVNAETAEFLRSVICDAVIAPGFESGALATLQSKRGGRFLIFEERADARERLVERRELLGIVIEQDADVASLADVVPEEFDRDSRTDALVALTTVRYTQSNSIAMVRDGAVVGVGAGQQNRVDCVRLAGAKADIWWLRRHPFVRALSSPGMPRQDLLNWQIRFAGREMTRTQRDEFSRLFGAEAREQYDGSWREGWGDDLTGITMASDGFLPFRDNVEHASDHGVVTILEPGGSMRTTDVTEAAREAGIAHVQTGLRLFRH